MSTWTDQLAKMDADRIRDTEALEREIDRLLPPRKTCAQFLDNRLRYRLKKILLGNLPVEFASADNRPSTFAKPRVDGGRYAAEMRWYQGLVAAAEAREQMDSATEKV